MNALKWSVWNCFIFTIVEENYEIIRKGHKGTSGNEKRTCETEKGTYRNKKGTRGYEKGTSGNKKGTYGMEKGTSWKEKCT